MTQNKAECKKGARGIARLPRDASLAGCVLSLISKCQKRKTGSKETFGVLFFDDII